MDDTVVPLFGHRDYHHEKHDVHDGVPYRPWNPDHNPAIPHKGFAIRYEHGRVAGIVYYRELESVFMTSHREILLYHVNGGGVHVITGERLAGLMEPLRQHTLSFINVYAPDVHAPLAPHTPYVEWVEYFSAARYHEHVHADPERS